MASTDLGRRLTEQHRLAQLQVRAAFLAEFVALWALLDPVRLDETRAGWVRAVLALIRDHRLWSSEVATRYFLEFRAAETPSSGQRPPINLAGLPDVAAPPRRPVVPRPPVRVPAAPARGRDGRLSPRQSRPASTVIPNPRSSRSVFDALDDPIFQQRPARRARIEVPDINWDREDKVVRVSLEVTGPVSQKAKAKRGKPLEQARDESLVEASGVASRHVLTGGRRSLLTLLDQDPQAVGWARVTDGDPCAFCAMLASRGVVYKTQQSAGFSAHDHCACTAEPAYSRDAPIPGRGQEFQDLWNEQIRGKYSGKDAARAWRRLYEKQQRDARRGEVA